MSRSGYGEYDSDHPNLDYINWRGAVAKAVRGRRGQAFLREMLYALDRLPAPRLIRDELEVDGEVCAIGAVGRARGVDMSTLDPEDYAAVAATFGIARALAQEIEYYNDEWFTNESPENRFARMRAWVIAHLGEHLTTEERRLARHALGLTNLSHRAYRNCFAAARRTPDYATWRGMVDQGYALRWPWFYSYGDHFRLTPRGVELALNAGETVGPEELR